MLTHRQSPLYTEQGWAMFFFFFFCHLFPSVMQWILSCISFNQYICLHWLLRLCFAHIGDLKHLFLLLIIFSQLLHLHNLKAGLCALLKVLVQGESWRPGWLRRWTCNVSVPNLMSTGDLCCLLLPHSAPHHFLKALCNNQSNKGDIPELTQSDVCLFFYPKTTAVISHKNNVSFWRPNC